MACSLVQICSLLTLWTAATCDKTPAQDGASKRRLGGGATYYSFTDCAENGGHCQKYAGNYYSDEAYILNKKLGYSGAEMSGNATHGTFGNVERLLIKPASGDQLYFFGDSLNEFFCGINTGTDENGNALPKDYSELKPLLQELTMPDWDGTFPLMLSSGEWASHQLATSMVYIIAREKFHLSTKLLKQGDSAAPMPGLTSCIEDQVTPGIAGCDDHVNTYPQQVHIDAEVWPAQYHNSIVLESAEGKARVVKNLVGYQGYETIFINQAVTDKVKTDLNFDMSLASNLKVLTKAQRRQYFGNLDAWMEAGVFGLGWATLNCIPGGEFEKTLLQMNLPGCNPDRWWYPTNCQPGDECIPLLWAGYTYLGTELCRLIEGLGLPVKISFSDEWADVQLSIDHMRSNIANSDYLSYVDDLKNIDVTATGPDGNQKHYKGPLTLDDHTGADGFVNPLMYWWKPDSGLSLYGGYKGDPNNDGFKRMVFEPYQKSEYGAAAVNSASGEPQVLTTDLPNQNMVHATWSLLNKVSPEMQAVMDRMTHTQAEMQGLTEQAGTTWAWYTPDYLQHACKFLKGYDVAAVQSSFEIFLHGDFAKQSTTTTPARNGYFIESGARVYTTWDNALKAAAKEAIYRAINLPNTEVSRAQVHITKLTFTELSTKTSASATENDIRAYIEFAVEPAPGWSLATKGIDAASLHATWLKGATAFMTNLKEKTKFADRALDVSQAMQGTAVRFGIASDVTRTAAKNDRLYNFEVCEPGSKVKGIGCAACAAGTYQPLKLQKACLDCEPGFYQPATGASVCTPASVGFYVDNKGATAQKMCLPGTTASVVASASCRPCDKGSAASKMLDSNGEATDVNTCSLCETGNYSDSNGAASCTKCPPLTTTVSWGSTSISDCVCTDGAFRSASGECETCPEGMSCPVGSSASNLGSTMMVQPGYWIPDAQEPFQVYMCHPLRETKEDLIGGCKGGGVAACDGLWYGKVCGECDGYRDVENKCRTCEGLDGIGFIAFLFFAFALSPIAYHVVNSELTAQISSAALVCVSMGSVVTVMQLSSILSQISIAWPSELTAIMQVFSMFAFDLRFMKPECAHIGVDTAGAKFYLTLFLLPMLAGWIFLVAYITQKISNHDEAANVQNLLKAKKGQKDPNYKPSPWWVMLRPETVNTIGTIYQAAFITIAMTTISPMRCYGHPNGDHSLVSDPQILCGEGEHPVMLAMGFLTMLLFVVCFIFYYIYTVHKMPALAAVDPLFYRSRKYMIFRFRSSTWYWGVVFLVRNFCCALTTVVDPNRPYLQTVLLVIVLLTYMVFQVRVWPWKTEGLNFIDLVSTWCIPLIVFFSSAFIFDASKEDEHTALWLVSIFYFLCIGTIVGFFLLRLKEFVQERLDPKRKAFVAKKMKEENEKIGMDFVTMCGHISKIVETEKRVRAKTQEGKTGVSSGPDAGYVVTQFLSSLGTLDRKSIQGVVECVRSECTSKFLRDNNMTTNMGDGSGSASTSSFGQRLSGGRRSSGRRPSLSDATDAIVSVSSKRSVRLSMSHYADDDVNAIANILQAEQAEQRDGDTVEHKDSISTTAVETEVENTKNKSGEETEV